MEGIYTAEQAAEYIQEKSGGTITKRAVIWYIYDKRGRAKAAREGVLKGERLNQVWVFTQAELDHFMNRYPEISVRGRKVGWRKQKEGAS